MSSVSTMEIPLPVERYQGEPLHEYIARVRRMKRGSQEKLAELLDVSQATVSNLEAGRWLRSEDRLSPGQLKALAGYLGLPVKQLREMVEEQRLRDDEARLERELTQTRTKLARFR